MTKNSNQEGGGGPALKGRQLHFSSGILHMCAIV